MRIRVKISMNSEKCSENIWIMYPQKLMVFFFKMASTIVLWGKGIEKQA
jgi:hypothetical protein